MFRIHFRTRAILAAAFVVVPTIALAASAGAPPATGKFEAVLVAARRDLNLTAAQARQAMARQGEAIEADRALKALLGQAFGGSWFDAGSGRLNVAITDPRFAATVNAAGAQAKLVRYGKARLGMIQAELDRLAGRTSTTGRTTATTTTGRDRSSGGPREATLAGLAGWYVDPETDAVVVTAVRGKVPSAALAMLATFGDAVRIEYVDNAPTAAGDFMDGGDAINSGSCSAGFNLRHPATGRGYLLTAGHCVSAGTIVWGRDSVNFGPVLDSFFPKQDDAIVRGDNPAYWAQGPWVDTSPSDGSFVEISGYTDAPVGTTVCKSGVTTRLTCGRITAKDETVTYGSGATIYGLTRHSACVEPGDSGGANYAVTAVNSAEGVTSGASLIKGRCRGVYGLPNISWYYPIADSLAYYRTAYGVTLW